MGTSGTITPAADIYSFGCCMLTMCVNGRTSAPAGAAHEPVGLLKQGITRCTDLAPFVPPDLDGILKVRSARLPSHACTSRHRRRRSRPVAASVCSPAVQESVCPTVIAAWPCGFVCSSSAISVLGSKACVQLQDRRCMQACLSKHAFERPTAADLVADLKARTAFNKHVGCGSAPAPVRHSTGGRVASPPPAPPSPPMLHRHLPHAPSFAELQQRYQHLRVSLDVLVPGRRTSPGPSLPPSGKHRQHSSVLTPSRLSSGCGSCVFSRSGTVQYESRSRSGGSMQGRPDVCVPSRSGEVQPGKRMPYTTSVRVGLAGISHPLHALTPQSSSGWFSDGSVSCASFAAPSMA